MEEKVLATLKAKGEPMKASEVAVEAGIDKAAADKAIKALVAKGVVDSPKRCYWGIKI